MHWKSIIPRRFKHFLVLKLYSFRIDFQFACNRFADCSSTVEIIFHIELIGVIFFVIVLVIRLDRHNSTYTNYILARIHAELSAHRHEIIFEFFIKLIFKIVHVPHLLPIMWHEYSTAVRP